MQVLSKISEVRNSIKLLKSQDKTISIVPTMGALHEGHLSLVEKAAQNSDIVVVSIFVNPTQFGKGEDFDKYPKNLESDLEKLETTKAKIIFAPNIEDIYGKEESSIEFRVKKYANILCGANRKGHFEGVCQIVAKLFNIIEPDIAVFGKKDFQQLFIIKQLVKELNFNIEVVGGDIIRDEYGLALSSRNRYLGDSELNIARKLNVLLKESLGKFKLEVGSWKLEAEEELLKAGFDKIDYIEIRNENNLELEEKFTDTSRIFAAAYIGNTRLIDNLKSDNRD